VRIATGLRIVGFAALLVIVAACGGESDTTETTSTGTAAVDPATAVVVTYYTALNASDIEAASATWPSLDTEAFLALTQGARHRVSVACSPGDETDSVLCEEVVISDDFTSPAGVQGQYTVRYSVDDGVITERVVLRRSEAIEDYEAAFGTWLEATHPDVYESSYQADGPYPFATVEQALAVIALVDEFLAQSDDYPIAQ
jgi:hypothetical protein